MPVSLLTVLKMKLIGDFNSGTACQRYMYLLLSSDVLAIELEIGIVLLHTAEKHHPTMFNTDTVRPTR